MSGTLNKNAKDFLEYCANSDVTIREDFFSEFKGKEKYIDITFSDRYRQKEIYSILHYFVQKEIKFGLTLYKRTITKEQATDFVQMVKVN